MNAKGLFYYVAMIVLAVGIAFFYIEPAFSDIRDMQDDIALYQEERQKIDAVNEELRTLVDRLDSVPVSDQQKLLTYMPNDVDAIAVSRTLQLIANQSGVVFESVSYGEVQDQYMNRAENEGESDYPVPHQFNFIIQGSYQQMKDMLRRLENNEYPIEVHSLDMSQVIGNLMTADVSIITYAHVEPDPSLFQ